MRPREMTIVALVGRRRGAFGRRGVSLAPGGRDRRFSFAPRGRSHRGSSCQPTSSKKNLWARARFETSSFGGTARGKRDALARALRPTSTLASRALRTDDMRAALLSPTCARAHAVNHGRPRRDFGVETFSENAFAGWVPSGASPARSIVEDSEVIDGGAPAPATPNRPSPCTNPSSPSVPRRSPTPPRPPPTRTRPPSAWTARVPARTRPWSPVRTPASFPPPSDNTDPSCTRPDPSPPSSCSTPAAPSACPPRR